MQARGLDSLDGIFVICRYKYDHGPVIIGAHLFQHLKSCKTRHLHIQEQEIGAQASDQGNGEVRVCFGTADSQHFPVPEQYFHPAHRISFIVKYENSATLHHSMKSSTRDPSTSWSPDPTFW